jgi:hypothetical protein
MSTQLRAGRQDREADGENSPPPRLGPCDSETRSGPRRVVASARTSLRHRCTEPVSLPAERCREVGRGSAGRGLTPATVQARTHYPGVYRGRRPPLPSGASAPASGSRRLLPASNARSGTRGFERDLVCWPRNCCLGRVLPGHIVVHERGLTDPRRCLAPPAAPPRRGTRAHSANISEPPP